MWADLAKIARKQKIWDVATAAALFCLCYDDERWTISGVLQNHYFRGHNVSDPSVSYYYNAYYEYLIDYTGVYYI